MSTDRTGLLARAALVAGLVLGLPTSAAFAQDAASDEEREELVVVGSRRAPRTVGDSPVPIDVIDGEDFARQGNTDMDSLLRGMIPSYNVNAQPISDAATIERPANLRRQPPDSTLIQDNGKRRHRAAVVAFLGGGISDVSQGPDVSVIPSIALKQVEVLRDGASAQYGSDAIAGVINFVLRDDPETGTIEARWGQFYEGDGDTWQIAGNVGFPLTENGFANFSLEFKEAEATSRSVQRDDALGLIAAGNTDVRTPASQVWGAPKIDADFKFFGNLGLDLGNGMEAYAFGNWAERTVEGGFFFRNPNTRGGVFSKDSGATILVADLTFGTADDGLSCPTVTISGNVPDPAALAAVAADSNCFAFNQKFPGGFTPQFGGDIADVSIVGGVKGELGWGDLTFDLSVGFGRSEVEYFISNTVSPNLAGLQLNMPTAFTPGGYVQQELSYNLDIAREIEFGMASPLNVAAGLEFREESFTIVAGDANSFFIDPNIAAQGFGIGSNGFPGFKPEDAGQFNRNSFAAYLDFEADVTEDVLINVAGRFEDFQDFGTTVNGKIAARWQIVDALAIRGAASTGFRAPTIGQANVRNVTTAFTNGVLADEATLPPTNPISIQKGGKALDPEESINLTFGLVLDLGDLNITADYFNIDVEDRIALTTTQILSAQDIAALIAQGVNDASSFTGVRFFTNDFDTTTQGIDLVATYPIEWAGGHTDLSFVFNWTDTKVDKFNATIIGNTRVKQLEDNLPDIRWSLTAAHVQGPLQGFLRLNYFANYFEAHLDDGTLPINAGAEVTLDAEIQYSINESVSVAIGAQNLLNNEPDKNPHSGIVGAEFPVTSPMGFNGGFYYLRAAWTFR